MQARRSSERCVRWRRTPRFISAHRGTQEQIKVWELPSRPTKTTDTRAKGFGDISVELDAIEPGRLRRLVEYYIEKHLPTHQLQVLQAAEASERTLLAGMVAKLRDQAAVAR